MLIHQIMKRQTWLFRSVQSESSFQAFGNVNVVGIGHAINQMGSSALAAILDAAALLLKLSTGWDWFIKYGLHLIKNKTKNTYFYYFFYKFHQKKLKHT